jgi:hypothetical protein
MRTWRVAYSRGNRCLYARLDQALYKRARVFVENCSTMSFSTLFWYYYAPFVPYGKRFEEVNYGVQISLSYFITLNT